MKYSFIFSHRLIQFSQAVIDTFSSGGDLLNRDGEAILKEVTKPGRDEEYKVFGTSSLQPFMILL